VKFSRLRVVKGKILSTLCPKGELAPSFLRTITCSSPFLLPSSSFAPTSMVSSQLTIFAEIFGLRPGLDGPLTPPPSWDQIKRADGRSLREPFLSR